MLVQSDIDVPVRSFRASVEERLLVPAYSSRWAFAPIAAHRSLAFPLQLAGMVHRWAIPVSGGTLQAVGIGRRKLVEPLCARLLGALPTAEQGSRRVLWSPASLAGMQADVVVAEVHRWMAPRFRRSGWLIVPEAVRWQGDLAEVPPVNPTRSLLEDLRKLRKRDFRLEHTTARRDWEQFYTGMVLPQARARHGESAWVPSPRLLDELARGGTLHLVVEGSERVAGACSVRFGDTLWLPLAGIRDGDPARLRQGAGIASMVLILAWAREQGCRRVDLGRTGPFVNDGIQQYKRKWGLHAVVDPLAHVNAVLVKSSSVREAFARQPVLVEDGAGLRTYAGETG